jgi:hypothetical protein
MFWWFSRDINYKFQKLFSCNSFFKIGTYKVKNIHYQIICPKNLERKKLFSLHIVKEEFKNELFIIKILKKLTFEYFSALFLPIFGTV